MAAAALLAARADVMATDKHGSTPLHWACKAGSYELVGLLLGARALVDAPTQTGSRALHLACEASAPKCVAMLLRARASCSTADGHGICPLHAASATGSVDSVRLLLAEGAAVNTQLHIDGQHSLSSLAEAHTKSPLYLAAEKGHAAVTTVLLEARADPAILARVVTEQTTTVTSALWAARRGKHAQVVELLLAVDAPEVAEMVDKASSEGGQVV